MKNHIYTYERERDEIISLMKESKKLRDSIDFFCDRCKQSEIEEAGFLQGAYIFQDHLYAFQECLGEILGFTTVSDILNGKNVKV